MTRGGGALQVLRAVGLYYIAMFVVGFGLGTVRTLLLEPRMSRFHAVLIEFPVILAAAWPVAGWCARRAGLGPEIGPRAAAAGLWFLLFLISETLLGHFMRGWELADTLSRFATPDVALGLIGFAFAALFLLWSGRT